MNKSAKIFIAGHRGLVGSALTRKALSLGYNHLILKTRSEVDLLDQAQVFNFFQKEKPDYVFLAAAKVGGIQANNTYRAEFIYQNLQIQNNIVHASYLNKVKKLLFLGSSCIYPKNTSQPMSEEALLTDTLEYTNEPYAIAKIAGIKLCESYNLQYGCNFISVMPTNLYGEGDNYDLEKSHVLPALVRKFLLAKAYSENDWSYLEKDTGLNEKHEIIKFLSKYGLDKNKVTLWGSGKPRREFLHSDDMADACFHIMENVNFEDLKQGREIRNTHINIGCGEDIAIRELAELIAELSGFQGEIVQDESKPDGTFQKLQNVSRLSALKWKARISLTEGLRQIIQNYKTQRL